MIKNSIKYTYFWDIGNPIFSSIAQFTMYTYVHIMLVFVGFGEDEKKSNSVDNIRLSFIPPKKKYT